MAIKKITEPEPRSTPLEAGDPVEQPALSQMGGTFAERQKAREAAERGEKQIHSDDAVEDKAITSAKSKRRPKKKA